MVKGAPTQRLGLVALVGAVAAAALFDFAPKFEGTELTTYRDMGGVLTYCTGATENAQWGKTYAPAQCSTATWSGTPPALPSASRWRA